MKLYLVQHGEALSEKEDPERSLSVIGREDIHRLAIQLVARDVRVARICHSGKRRAEQSAQLLLEGGVSSLLIEQMDGLAPNDSVQNIGNVITDWSDDSILVGHQPFMGRLASLLLTSDPGVLKVAFQPGAAVCLERDAEGAWRLLWMLSLEP